MPTIPPNNSTGLYGIDSQSAIDNGSDISVGNIFASGNITAIGNIAGDYILGNGSQLTGLPEQYGNANVAAYLPTYTGNLAGGNIAITDNGTIDGNLTVGGTIYGTFAGNISGNLVVPGSNTDIIYNNSGNAGASNDFTWNDSTKVVDVNGNVQANYFIGNGSQLTGLPASYGNSNVATFLANYGSNTVTTTGNITGGNVIGTYLYGDGSNITGVTPSSQSTRIEVKNTSGLVLSKGTPVYATGTVGATTVLEVSPSRADTPASLPCVGLLDAGLAVNATGYAISVGTLTNVDTASFTVGHELYVAAAGGLTMSRPTGSNIVQSVGTVGRVNASTGSIAVNVWNINPLPNLSSGKIWQGNATGYPTETTPYGNANVAAYLPTYTGNLNGSNLNITQDVHVTGDVYAGTYYGTFAGNISGNLVVPGSNTWVIYNDNGNAGADSDFTFNSANSSVAVTGNIRGGNIVTAGNVSGAYILGNGSQLTGLPAGYSNANVSTYLASGTNTGNIITTGNISGAYFSGSGALLTSLPGANVVGAVANATYAVSAGTATSATTAGTVTTNAQPNITSVGTLSSLAVTGNVTAGNVNSTFYGSGAGLSSLTGANVTGTVANATYATSAGTATSALTAGTVTTNAQPNITSVGTLSSLSVTGNITSSANVSANAFITTGSGGSITGVNYLYANTVIANTQVISTGPITAGVVNYANTDGTAGQVLTTYGNGNTHWTTVSSGGTYGDSNVNTLLASWGSNTLSTTGNVTAGNIKSGAVTYTPTDGTAGQVLTTYGNGKTYFSSAGGSYGNADVNTLLAAWGSNTLSTTGTVTTGNLTPGNISLPLNSKVTGEFGLAITAGRPWFQSSNTGTASYTFLSTVPGPTNTNINAGGITHYGNIDVGNATFGGLQLLNNEFRIRSGNAGTATSLPIAFQVAGGEIMRMTTTGNVGIGNTTPTHKLSIQGSEYVSGNVYTGGILTDNYYYANGTPISFGGTYGDSNVTTLLASLGSNVISSTANVTTTANIAGDNVSATGNVTSGNLISGAVTYTPTDGTTGQVLTTYGNGQTYFSTVSGGGGSPGGSNTQLQFNDAGSFAGNAAMTFDNTTGNIGMGNLVIGNIGTGGTFYNVITNKNPFLGNTTTMPSNARILIGSGKNGDWSTSVDYNSNSRNARLVIADEYVKADNGIRTTEFSIQSYANLNGVTTFGSANNNSRISASVNDLYIMNGNITASNPILVRGIGAAVNTGTGANANMSNVSHASAITGTIVVNTGSSVGNAFGVIGSTANPGVIGTQVAFAVQLGGNANSSGNAYGIFNPSNINTYGITNGNTARGATNYYFIRNEDILAKNQIGQMNRYFDGLANCGGSTSGAVTVDAANGQFQYLNITEAVTSVSFTNFINFVSKPNFSVDGIADTVTLLITQDATGRAITMPTSSGSNIYKYAGGMTTVSTTPNSVTLVSITCVIDGSSNNVYLITISPEFS